jgi:hypothetical protein
MTKIAALDAREKLAAYFEVRRGTMASLDQRTLRRGGRV